MFTVNQPGITRSLGKDFVLYWDHWPIPISCLSVIDLGEVAGRNAMPPQWANHE